MSRRQKPKRTVLPARGLPAPEPLAEYSLDALNSRPCADFTRRQAFPPHCSGQVANDETGAAVLAGDMHGQGYPAGEATTFMRRTPCQSF
jgi:hypothetical protein